MLAFEGGVVRAAIWRAGGCLLLKVDSCRVTTAVVMFQVTDRVGHRRKGNRVGCGCSPVHLPTASGIPCAPNDQVLVAFKQEGQRKALQSRQRCRYRLPARNPS